MAEFYECAIERSGSINSRGILTSWGSVSFSRRTLSTRVSLLLLLGHVVKFVSTTCCGHVCFECVEFVCQICTEV